MGLYIKLKQNSNVSCGNDNTHMDDQTVVYNTNITHNLNKMACEAGIYEALWRPYKLKNDYMDFGCNYDAECEFENSQKIKASEIIPFLEKGLLELKSKPEYFKKFNSPNGWGTYEHFVPFVENYLNACRKHSSTIVCVDR